MDANRKGMMANLDRASANNFEKPIYNEQPNEMDVQLPMTNELNADNEMVNQRKKQLKSYILNNINRAEGRDQYGSEIMQEQLQEQQQQQPPPPEMDEYQNYYDENDRRLNYVVNSNRDVRSDDNSPGKIESEKRNSVVTHPLDSLFPFFSCRIWRWHVQRLIFIAHATEWLDRFFRIREQDT